MSDLSELAFIDPQQDPGLAHARIPGGGPMPWPAGSDAGDPDWWSVRVIGAGTVRTLQEWLTATYTTSLLVLRPDGSPALEWYRDDCDAQTLFLGASATKSQLASLVGLAVLRDELSLDDPVTRYVPEFADGGYADCRVLDVITMTSGVDWVEDHRDPFSPASRLVRAFIGASGEASRDLLTQIAGGVGPGRRWVYNTADSQVLDWIRERATGRTFAEELTTLWQRLGVEDEAAVSLDAAGVAMAGGGLAATTRSWGRLGRLALTGVDRDEVPLLPDGWTAEAFAPATEFCVPGTLPATITSLLGFGRHWWPVEPTGTVATADGSRGQFVYVDTVSGLVIVKTSLWPYSDPFVDRQGRDLSIQGLVALGTAYRRR